MLNCFSTERVENAIPIHIFEKHSYDDWLGKQTQAVKNWVHANGYQANQGAFLLIPDEKTGSLLQVIFCVSNKKNFWEISGLPLSLPEGKVYKFDHADHDHYALGWGLGAYQFTRYKKPLRKPAVMHVAKQNFTEVENILKAIYLVRDLINIPADDMGPSELASIAKKIADEFGAQYTEIVGDALLTENFPCIYTVGRACDDAPRLIELRWGNSNHPRLTLVGKGVCFDTGGLDLKPYAYMSLMKKDMAGAAHVLGLAHMIMGAKLPISLRILIPAVENSVSGKAYRPGDIITSRKGLTIEIGNTDAEGRLILADAITAAIEEKPDLLIDMATLTGAARVALGPELPVLFCNHETLASDLIEAGTDEIDPMWRLPLYPPYREYLNSSIADINNYPSEAYGGAITAGLFLKEFVPDTIRWAHFDLMAWNLRTKPGHPQGGEAMALRAIFSYLKQRFLT